MADGRQAFEEMLARLTRLRDEIKVQAHLGKAEARDEWERLERKWRELQSDARPFLDAAGQTGRGVGSALELAAEELKAGYDRLRKLL